jgi:uncharacterized protein with ATP-grasp and redox domains
MLPRESRRNQKPPQITTGDRGSFAERTILDRKPWIIGEVIKANGLSGPEKERLESFGAEIRGDAVRSPFEGGSFRTGAFSRQERRTWVEEIALYRGRTWLDIPWYFAESFFYLRLLIAFGYYDGGVNPRWARDPFQILKDGEMTSPGGGLEFARRLTGLLGDIRDEDRLPLLLRSALWGNRADLSTFGILPEHRRGALSVEEADLVLNDTKAVGRALSRSLEISMILDNSGPELVSDLILSAHLLREDPGRRITLHLKRAPFFVSDAMVKDAEAVISAFANNGDPGLRRIGNSLREEVSRGRLVLCDHFFWNGPLHFTRFPTEIAEGLSASDLVIIKGDANYRRILEDRKWPAWTRMEEVAFYFPAPFAVLRTMKSEIVVDVPKKKAGLLDKADPDWLTNGRRGIIRFVDPRSYEA